MINSCMTSVISLRLICCHYFVIGIVVTFSLDNINVNETISIMLSCPYSILLYVCISWAMPSLAKIKHNFKLVVGGN